MRQSIILRIERGIWEGIAAGASLNNSTFWNPWNPIGFRGPGRWVEVFNGDVYNNWRTLLSRAVGVALRRMAGRFTVCRIPPESPFRPMGSGCSLAITVTDASSAAG